MPLLLTITGPRRRRRLRLSIGRVEAGVPELPRRLTVDFRLAMCGNLE